MHPINETHDVGLSSWVASANDPDGDFPIQNLPFGVFRCGQQSARVGVAIGDQILDLRAAHHAGLFHGAAQSAVVLALGETLNELMGSQPECASSLRRQISRLLRMDGSDSERALALADRIMVPMRAVEMQLPATIGDFSDFLTSIYHAERAGRVVRPDNPVDISFKYLPYSYHSRASSIRVSGEPMRRPYGQWKGADGRICFGPSEQLDFELELGVYVGRGNALGQPIAIDRAGAHAFGYCLLNDWSLRDFQRWQSAYGPFLAKSSLTTVSPWVVTAEALAPFAAPASERGSADPPLLPYLHCAADQRCGGLDLDMRCLLQSAQMRKEGTPPLNITRTNFRHVYWTFAQMIVHHTSNGCDLRPGDLLGSGTVSGPMDESRACLAELTTRGTVPLVLPNGESRGWLEDGDEVIFRARASRKDFVSIGFGECRGIVTAARADAGAAEAK